MTDENTDEVPDADEYRKNNTSQFHDRRTETAMDGKGPRGP